MNRIFLLLSTIFCTVYCANSVADVVVKLGEDATFTCEFDHKDSFIISWFVLNSEGEATKLLKYVSENAETMKINEESHAGREFVADGNTFTIKATEKADNKNFAKVQCEVESGTNSDIAAGSLTVEFMGDISSKMEKEGVFDVDPENKQIVATCTVLDAFPKPEIKFLINGEEHPKEENNADSVFAFGFDLSSEFENADGSFTVTDEFSIIVEAKLDNSVVSCQVSSGDQIVVHNVGTMRVKHDVSDVIIENADEALTEGVETTVTCRSNGYPDPMIVNFGIDGAEGSVSPLTFTPTSDMNGKALSCSSKLEAGQETAVVATKTLVVNFNKNVQVSGAAAVEVLSDVNLQCTSAANPAATYSWMKGDDVVGEGETLTLSQVGFDAAGDYVCVSKSLTDVSSAPVSVSVSGMVLESKAQNVSTANADKEGITMVCSAEASSAPTFVWTNGDAVHEGAVESEGLMHSSTLTLSAEKVTPELSQAVFTCTATLGGNSKSAAFTLDVIEEKSGAAGIVIGILVVILLIAVIIGFMYYKGMICKSEGKGGDETADDINVEMRNDADVEAGEAEKEKLVEEPAAAAE